MAYFVTEWQDSIKWNTMVMSLTLPQPTTPEVKQIGRSNMVVEWESDYFPAQEWTSDISGGMSSGFNLTVCEISSVESVLLSDASSKLDSVATGCSVVSYPSNSFNRIAASDSKSGSGNSVVYRTTVGELSPNTSYAFRWVDDLLKCCSLHNCAYYLLLSLYKLVYAMLH